MTPLFMKETAMDFSTFEKVIHNNQSEEGVIARFYDQAVKTSQITKDGLPKFKLVCFCEIRIKDNSSEVYNQPATPDKIRRFPNEYARYKQAKKCAEEGTPLEQFAFLDAAEIAGLKVRGIYTVEHLTKLDAVHAEELGIAKERELAIKFVEQAKGNALLVEWQKKEQEYQRRIKELEAKVENLQQPKKIRSKDEKHTRNMSRRS